MTLYHQSGLGNVLEVMLVINGKQYCLYGDMAYLLRQWLQTAFPRLNTTEQEISYNKMISVVHTAVEWT